MSLYIGTDGEIRDLPDDLVSAWAAAGNPKSAAWTLLPARPSDAHQWIGGEWSLPTQPVPESVTARQIRLYLVRHGIQLSQVEAAIEAIQDPQTREECRVEWHHAPYVDRTHPMLIPIAAVLGLSEAQVDDAFREAAAI
jgi:hypothetical protein